MNLQEIASLQGIYVMENDVYATLPTRGHIGGGVYKCDDGSGEDNALGFRPEDCRSMRYGYESNGTPTEFVALAKATPPMNVYPGCTSDDILELKHDTEIRVCMDAVKNCPGDGSDGSCTVPTSCSPSYSSWGSCVLDPGQNPANVCPPGTVTGTQERTITVTCTTNTTPPTPPTTTTTTERKSCDILGTKICPDCSSCTTWVEGTPPSWAPACDASNLDGKQRRIFPETCNLPDSTVCTRDGRTETRDCPDCTSCTSWTLGTVNPAAWSPACNASNLTGKQTQTVTDTCSAPAGFTHCTRDVPKEQDCPCSEPTFCCNTSGLVALSSGGNCAADGTYDFDPVACECTEVRDTCLPAEQVCEPRDANGIPKAGESCRKCEINTLTNAKEWKSCTCPLCNNTCIVGSPDDPAWVLALDENQANVCTGVTIPGKETRTVTTPHTLPSDPCPSLTCDHVTKTDEERPASGVGTKETTCEDGCGAWGAGADHNYTSTSWWATVWMALQGLVESTNRMWQVTWDGGKDPSNSDDITSKCVAAGNPTYVTFEGDATRTRVCPKPGLVPPICPPVSSGGCDTEEERDVSVTMPCGCGSYDCDTQCNAYTPAAPYSNDQVSLWEPADKDPDTIAASTCHGETGMANGSVPINRTCPGEPDPKCCNKKAQASHEPTVLGTKTTTCDDGCSAWGDVVPYSGISWWSKVWNDFLQAVTNSEETQWTVTWDTGKNPVTDKAALCASDRIASGTARRTRTCNNNCEDPTIGKTTTKPSDPDANPCPEEDEEYISYTVDCSDPHEELFTCTCAANVVATSSNLCLDPSGDDSETTTGDRAPTEIKCYCGNGTFTDTSGDGTIDNDEKDTQCKAISPYFDLQINDTFIKCPDTSPTDACNVDSYPPPYQKFRLPTGGVNSQTNCTWDRMNCSCTVEITYDHTSDPCRDKVDPTGTCNLDHPCSCFADGMTWDTENNCCGTRCTSP